MGSMTATERAAHYLRAAEEEMRSIVGDPGSRGVDLGPDLDRPTLRLIMEVTAASADYMGAMAEKATDGS